MIFRKSLLAFAFLIPGVWGQTQSIPELIGESASFSVLGSALDSTDLDSDLGEDGPFTVFAPNDRAWENLRDLAPRFYDRLMSRPWRLHLVQILLTHIVSGSEIAAADIMDQQNITVASEQGVIASVSDGEVSINPAIVTGDATVVQADIAASNGVIHEIDDILQPTFLGYTTYELATEEEYTFATLVDMAGLRSFYDERLGFTTFIPTNDAFESLDDDVVEFLTSERGRPFLRKVLLYHTVNDVYPAGQIPPGTTRLRTFQGESVIIDNEDGDIEVNAIEVEEANVLVSNGIVHIIDSVLIPPSLMFNSDMNGGSTPGAVPTKGKGYYSASSPVPQPKGKGGYPYPAAKGKGYSYSPPTPPAKGKGSYSTPPAKGKGYYPTPPKGKGYYSPPPPAKGKGYYSPPPPAKGYYSPPPPAKGYYSPPPPAKGKGYYYPPPPAKGKGYYYPPPPAKGKGYYYPPPPAKGYSMGTYYSYGMGMGMGMMGMMGYY